jgi:hypothetical protein
MTKIDGVVRYILKFSMTLANIGAGLAQSV